MHIYYLTLSMGWESGDNLSGSLKAAVEVVARLCPHLEAWLGKNMIPSPLRLVAEFIYLWL